MCVYHCVLLLNELLMQLKRGRGSNSMFRSQPLDQLFSMDDFLADVEASVRPFLERLTTTQVLLQLVLLLLHA
jgi:preprotein translocase subunit SecG